MNRFYEAFPELEGTAPVTCEAGAVPPQSWPPVPGEYFILCEHKTAHVVVSTLASITLAEKLARLAPRDLCLVGKTETENIGIEKVIQNTITPPSIISSWPARTPKATGAVPPSFPSAKAASMGPCV
jgi:tetrahydromethanopterin S-methyltransferase subunit A